ncbi:MAG: hypothetical protein JSV61_08170, partial [Anaerolineales bacterium]
IPATKTPQVSVESQMPGALRNPTLESEKMPENKPTPNCLGSLALIFISLLFIMIFRGSLI